MRTVRFLTALAVAGAWLLNASAQHALALHVAVAHAAPGHSEVAEPMHGHHEAVVHEGDHSHALVLDPSSIARIGSGLPAPQVPPAELPPAFADVGPQSGPVDPDPESPTGPHPLERHPSLRL